MVTYNNNGSLKNTVLLYLHVDHLNTPRVATDQNQTTVWAWSSDAFGVGRANKDPDGDGIKHNVRLRFPGQYADGETGLYYNYFRDYDRTTGRYVQSDPIGLNGGINTFGYVGGNPLFWSDPTGLVRWGDLAFGLVDFTLSTTEAAGGLGIMFGSTVSGPAAPAVFLGGAAVAAHGISGMLNSGLSIQNALYDTSGPGFFEGVCGLISEDFADAGRGIDLFTGIRPGAMSVATMESAVDVYNVASTLNTMNNEIGGNR